MSGTRVVQLDRRAERLRDEDGVRERFGVPPASIPDYLALVGDSADGFPGLPGWGAKSAAAVLARYGRIEAIPDDAADWDVAVRGAGRLAATLAERARAGRAVPARSPPCAPTPPGCSRTASTSCAGAARSDGLQAVCADLDAPDVLERAGELAAGRAG